jgi:hypothetical protein
VWLIKNATAAARPCERRISAACMKPRCS